MLADSQDVELLANRIPGTSRSKNFNRRDQLTNRRRVRRPRMGTSVGAEDEQIISKDVPHCETCLCLPGRIKCLYSQMSFCDRFPGNHEQALDNEGLRIEDLPNKFQDSRSTTSRRRSGRNTTVDKLLREMDLSASVGSDQKPDSQERGRHSSPRPEYSGNQQTETNADYSSRHRCQRRRSSRAGSYYETTRCHSEFARMSEREARIRSCERINLTDRRHRSFHAEKGLVHQSGEEIVVPTIDNIGSDNDVLEIVSSGKKKWVPLDRKNSNVLLGAGDLEGLRVINLDELNVIGNDNPKVLLGQGEKDSLPSEQRTDDMDSSFKDLGTSEAHVRELKLVRLEFIERIYEEMRRLQRLQRHLDGCSPNRVAALTRSISTMTSARK